MNNYIELAKIEEKSTIRDLIQPYLDELSRFPDDDPDPKDEDGRYRYPYLDNYWQEDTRFPYLFYHDAELAGFALVSYYDGYWRIAEIYILPEFRRYGVAFDCVKEVFGKHPGKWQIGFNKSNTPSRSLWDKLSVEVAASEIVRDSLDANHDCIRFTIE